ncbi:MAG: hypothetical protein AAGA74_15070 [Pseudomonadota bacterium]
MKPTSPHPRSPDTRKTGIPMRKTPKTIGQTLPGKILPPPFSAICDRWDGENGTLPPIAPCS